jgi:hypothetical protein
MARMMAWPLGQLQIHLHQRLLHALDLLGLLLDERVAMAHQSTHHAHPLLGAKRALQQPIAHQLLQPLAVEHVGLAPRHVLDVARVDQQHPQPVPLQQFVHRNPVHPGGFRGHGVDRAADQPIGQLLQIGGAHAELAHRLARAVGGDRHVVRRAPHIEAESGEEEA